MERVRPARRRALTIAALVGYLALLWFVVFPWLDGRMNAPGL